ncbi:MAG TPA: ABC transporter permease [Candidatus Acidoferrales bacterium]|nr:ABC transporter permease [Candidatus Acidoferrales bacterium]
MSRLRQWLARVAGLFHRERADQRLRAELESHLQMLAEENVRRGMTAAQARQAARRTLGSDLRIGQAWREQRGVPWVETFARDAVLGLRMMRKHPGFAALAIATLALGIGANTAIFSVVDAVLLRPLPYPHPSQLVSVFATRRPANTFEGTSYPNLEDERAWNTAFTGMGGSNAHQLTLTGRGEPSLANTVVVSGDYFPVLQAKPLAGRTILPEDTKLGAAPVVLLSENIWRGRLGADPKIVGSSITLDKRPFTVVGIMPAGFRDPFFASTAQVWIPVHQDPVFGPLMRFRAGSLLGVLARLKPGVSLEQAQSQMAGIAERLAANFPGADESLSIHVVLLQQILVGDVKAALLVLLGAVGLVLLIACVNIANLLLARASARGKEMGIRLVLGAGRSRIVRQLLTESVVLGLLGGGGGVLLAYAGVQAMVSILPADLPGLRAVAVDGRVLGFGLLLSLAASILFGLAPAILSADACLRTSLREGAGRSGDGGGRRRARNVLAVAEIALAMVLLVGAGLLLHSFLSLTYVNPGFDGRQVWKADVSLPQYEYSTPQQWTAFADQLLPRIQTQPGLRDSALAVPLPVFQQFVNLSFTIAGNPPLPQGVSDTADYVSVSPDYFRVMAIPLLAGRNFNRQDSIAAPPVTLVSEALVRRYFPGENPIGRRMIFAFPRDKAVAREIVGVVGDIRDKSLEHPSGPMMYVPFDQAPLWGGAVVVRSELSPAAIAAAIRRQAHAIDPDLPVTDFESISYAVQATASPARFRALVFGLLGLIALVLASAGIFGVLSYSVSRRTHELGIRMALGATPPSIRRMVLREGGILAAAGLGIGTAAGLYLTRLLESQLYGVGADDPWTFAATAILLAGVALAACYLPARRAMRVDPTIALRYE